MTLQERADLYARAMHGLAHPIRRNLAEDPDTGFLAFVENRPYADRDRRLRQFRRSLADAGFAVVAEGKAGADVFEGSAGGHTVPAGKPVNAGVVETLVRTMNGRPAADPVSAEVAARERGTKFLPDYAVSLLIDPGDVPDAKWRAYDLAAEALGPVGQEIG